MKSLTTHVCHVGKMEMEARDIIANNLSFDADQQRYSAPLIEDVDKHMKALIKLTTLLKKLKSEKPSGGIPQMQQTLEKTTGYHKTILSMAAKMGLASVTKKPTKKKARVEEQND